MKKLVILVAVLLFASLASQAQTSKGDQTLGADLGFSYSKGNQLYLDPSSGSVDNSSNGKTTSFTISPNYSYFIADNLDLGASLDYVSYVNNANNTNPGYQNKNANRTYGASVFLRKYFMYQNKIGLRVGAYISYDKQTYNYDYPEPNSINDYDSNQDDYIGGLNLALVYYPAKHLGLSASLANLSYTHSKANNGDQGTSSNNTVDFGYINDGLTCSVFYVFGGK